MKSGSTGPCFANEVFSQTPDHDHFLAPFGDFKSTNLLNLSCESRLEGSINLDSAIEKSSSIKEPEHVTKSIHYNDTLLYIYTSGTTGN